ncbi:hypothetical protein HAX54_028268, partial [Datura stramonium]|nr:hypothetical protein [Datura stramonium]
MAYATNRKIQARRGTMWRMYGEMAYATHSAVPGVARFQSYFKKDLCPFSLILQGVNSGRDRVARDLRLMDGHL